MNSTIQMDYPVGAVYYKMVCTAVMGFCKNFRKDYVFLFQNDRFGRFFFFKRLKCNVFDRTEGLYTMEFNSSFLMTSQNVFRQIT